MAVCDGAGRAARESGVKLLPASGEGNRRGAVVEGASTNGTYEDTPLHQPLPASGEELYASAISASASQRSSAASFSARAFSICAFSAANRFGSFV